MLICESVKKTLNRSGGAGKTPSGLRWSVSIAVCSPALQYMDYFNTYHLRAARFVQSLVDLRLAVDEPIPVISTKNRTRVCRITHKSIYRELGIPNVRHRRIADPAVYLRRLLSLDYVIDHPELEWLPTETEKVWFCKHLDIRKDRLPRRLYTGAAGTLTRYFP